MPVRTRLAAGARADHRFSRVVPILKLGMALIQNEPYLRVLSDAMIAESDGLRPGPAVASGVARGSPASLLVTRACIAVAVLLAWMLGVWWKQSHECNSWERQYLQTMAATTSWAAASGIRALRELGIAA
jgi:hypothetical protein